VAKRSTETLIDAFEKFRGYKLYQAQIDAIGSNKPALWLVAGPGTGKTETLALKVLRLLFVDRVAPNSIIFTTFTNRAARELQNRLSIYADGILEDPAFEQVDRPDISNVWVGTLHGLALDIMRQMAEEGVPITVLDDTGSMFALLARLRAGTIMNQRLYRGLNGYDAPPYQRRNRMHFAERLKATLDRVVEDDLDMRALREGRTLRQEAPVWGDPLDRVELISALDEYESSLGHNSDFARIQSRFLAFLVSNRSNGFLNGDEERKLPRVRHVIVDEYQDTNPIQEAIYFGLCRYGATLTVDQSLYRFRGASVDSMTSFPERVTELPYVSESRTSVRTVELIENRRSHPKIVEALNDYISCVSTTTSYGAARVSKQALVPKSSVGGGHVPFFVLVRKNELTLAKEVSSTIGKLWREKQVSDPRQVAVLASSTKTTKRSPFRHYQKALTEAGLPVFNPGAKDLSTDVALRALVGLMCEILDPRQKILRLMSGELPNEITGRTGIPNLVENAESARRQHRTLAQRVDLLRRRFGMRALSGGRTADEYPATWNFLDLFYEIVNQPPFSEMLDKTGGPAAARSAWRMAWLTRLLEGFQMSRPQSGRLLRALGDAATRRFYTVRGHKIPNPIRGVSPYVVSAFYRDFVALFLEGGFDEVEDELQSIPEGTLPILTIHQSKGLEFPIVFVACLSKLREPGAEYYQESLFHPYRKRAISQLIEFDSHERAVHDEIRRLFVAMSRAKFMCGLCLTEDVYDGIVQRSPAFLKAFPHLPPKWLERLPRL